MDRVKLSYKTFEELNELRLSIENNSSNKSLNGSFHIYKIVARRKLDDIAWAVTNRLARTKGII